MSFTPYQPSFQPKTHLNPPDSNLNNSPYRQANYQNVHINKTSQLQPQQFMNPSSMNSNFLQVGSKYPTKKLSPSQFDKKQDTYKNADMGTAKSMVFMGYNQGSASLNQPKKTLGGLSKLSSMARTADKNFDDSGDFDQAKTVNLQQNSTNFQEGKIGNLKKFGNSLGEQLNPNIRSYQAKQPSVSSSMFFNVGQESNNVYKSFMNPGTSISNPGTSSSNPGSDGKKVGSFDFLLKYKEQKKQKELVSGKIGQNKGMNYSSKVGDNGTKEFSWVLDNAHHKLFHEYSAPDLMHGPKLNSFEPVKTPMFNKTEFNAKLSSQFDSPTQSNSQKAHFNKYASPQQGLNPTLLAKHNTEKPDTRFNPSKNFAFDLNPVQNQQNSFSPSTAFSKKQKTVQQDFSKGENTTPNKQKFISPSFFKNKQAKLSQAKTLQTIPSPSSAKISEFSDSNESPTQIKSTLSDDDSNGSIQNMNEDFCYDQLKEWSLEDFEIGDKLGKGAFGDVFIAREKQLGFMCVLKKMSKKRIKEQKRQEHVIRELKIQMYLNHKHLTAMYGYFHDKDHIYLILEYLPDGNLSQIKKRKKTSEKQTANILKQVCEGLDFMHKHSIIHRDIKPQNIFCNENYMKLGDFGCSVCTDGMRRTIVSCLEYSSPQQLSGGQYNEKIDIWGIGVLAYELLTGRSPYEKQIMNMSNVDVDFRALKFPEELKLSQLAKDFIRSLLNVDPIDRMNIHETLEHKFITSNFEPPVQLV